MRAIKIWLLISTIGLVTEPVFAGKKEEKENVEKKTKKVRVVKIAEIKKLNDLMSKKMILSPFPIWRKANGMHQFRLGMNNQTTIRVFYSLGNVMSTRQKMLDSVEEQLARSLILTRLKKKDHQPESISRVLKHIDDPQTSLRYLGSALAIGFNPRFVYNHALLVDEKKREEGIRRIQKAAVRYKYQLSIFANYKQAMIYDLSELMESCTAKGRSAYDMFQLTIQEGKDESIGEYLQFFVIPISTKGEKYRKGTQIKIIPYAKSAFWKSAKAVLD